MGVAILASAIAMWGGMAGTLAQSTLLPHGVCYLWNTSLIGLHLASDTLIGLAYFTIPITLVYFIRKRSDLPFNWMFLLFGLFIVACGATHWMEVWTLWHPDYWLSGVVKAITAAASVPTAIALVMLVPQALQIPSTRELAAAKAALETEVAQRKRIEAELREAQITLEARVEERTRELALANANVQLANQALKEDDERKNRFLAILSHELRNPLNPIRSAVAVLRQPGLEAQQAHHAREIIDRQVTHLARLLDDLLDVSRITQNRVSLARKRVDVSEAAATALEAARPQVEASGQELSVLLPEQPLLIDADSTRLTQIISNLLNNASKYTDAGGRIALEVAREGGEAVIRVRDSGVGVEAGELERVFDLFSRVKSPHNESVGGLGIGLALVKSLVELHGGRVSAMSEGLGRGSTFTVRLPVAGAQDEPIAGSARAAKAAIRGLRLLVVDDNIDSAVSLALLLEVSGHDVEYAHDAADALVKAARFRPQVCIFDIGMPVMDGFQLARQVRSEPWGKSMFLIALTGWGKNEDKERAMAAGFDRHMTKPVDPESLERELRAVAERSFK
jgi:signal transduction histidine kinase/ActR/RegA family two-component response regulator